MPQETKIDDGDDGVTANTQSSGSEGVSVGFVVLMCSIAASVVGVVAFVIVKTRRKQLEELKTPQQQIQRFSTPANPSML